MQFSWLNDQSKFVKYGIEATALINRARRKGEDEAVISVKNQQKQNVEYIIDFENMKQIRKDNAGLERQIQSELLDIHAVPTEIKFRWQPGLHLQDLQDFINASTTATAASPASTTTTTTATTTAASTAAAAAAAAATAAAATAAAAADPSRFEDFPDVVNKPLALAYWSGREKVPIEIPMPGFTDGVKFVVNFVAKTITRADNLPSGGLYSSGSSAGDRAIKIVILRESTAWVPQITLQTLTRHWSQQDENAAIAVKVIKDSPEWTGVAKKMPAAVAMKIANIERIEHYRLLKSVFHTKIEPVLKADGDPNVRQLFHGTKTTSPETIWKDPLGFVHQYAADSCLWGKGSYFAEMVEYSLGDYAHKIPGTNQKQLFLCDVVIGVSTPPLAQDNTLTMAPMDATTNKRYDSVQGRTTSTASGPCTIFITYTNYQAYPSYLITFNP